MGNPKQRLTHMMWLLLSIPILTSLPLRCNADNYRSRLNDMFDNPALDSIVIRRQCEDNSQCWEREYCSGGLCRSFGSCETLLDCLNPSNVYRMDNCIGYVTCLEGGYCDIVCSGSFCPPNQAEHIFNCQEPCSRTSCSGHVACAEYLCDGCNAVYFDAAGNQVACDDPAAGQARKTCRNSSGCDEGQYCAAGECLDVGRCLADIDCYNPQNNGILVEVSECSNNGPRKLQCNDDGFCSQLCEDCPFSCVALGTTTQPCSILSCNDPDSVCINEDCGCEAIFFDLAGNHVCRTAFSEFDITGLRLHHPP